MVILLGRVAAAVCALMVAQDQAKKDNPQYEYWAKCKPGSVVKYKLEGTSGGQPIEMEQTRKLIEVSPEKAVVENSGKMKAGGQEFPMPARKEDVTAKEEEGKERTIDKQGEEEVEVGGKKLKCKWMQLTENTKGTKTPMKIWLTHEIPGGLAKAEITMPDGGTMKMSALEWDKK